MKDVFEKIWKHRKHFLTFSAIALTVIFSLSVSGLFQDTALDIGTVGTVHGENENGDFGESELLQVEFQDGNYDSILHWDSDGEWKQMEWGQEVYVYTMVVELDGWYADDEDEVKERIRDSYIEIKSPGGSEYKVFDEQYENYWEFTINYLEDEDVWNVVWEEDYRDEDTPPMLYETDGVWDVDPHFIISELS